MAPGAWRADHGGEIGYFDAHNLPLDARVVLLAILVNVSVVDDLGHTTEESGSFSMAFSVPLPLPLPLPIAPALPLPMPLPGSGAS